VIFEKYSCYVIMWRVVEFMKLNLGIGITIWMEFFSESYYYTSMAQAHTFTHARSREAFRYYTHKYAMSTNKAFIC